jgi:response regulator RpfG family c-di-GMP phosphodiesterase
MTLFQDTGGDPRAARSVVADVLTWYGAVGDAVLGNPPGFARRKASIATSLAHSAGIAEDEANALYFAGLLHAAGAIGNRAYVRGERLSERIARMESWDVPAGGARVCAQILALPRESADLVRWQFEAWDGTGYPDQLRWFGIPRSAQALHLADRFARAVDPEEALAAAGMDAGRAFGPDHVRAFTLWFHHNGGEAPDVEIPLEALNDPLPDPLALLDVFADAIDDHNATPGRWRRIDSLAREAAAALSLDAGAAGALAVAARIYGAGEITHEKVDDAFDALARLGMEPRARDAATAASYVTAQSALAPAAQIVLERGEWYDGSGKPAGHRRDAIPLASRILAAVIAHDALDRKERLETASGVQFDPNVVRAVLGTRSRA